MKTKQLLRRLALPLFATLVVISSCKKESSETAMTDEQNEEATVASVEGNAEADIIFNGVFDDVVGVNSEVGIEGTGIFGHDGSNRRCFTVTVTRLQAPAPFPLRVVMDFGTGCLGKDGHTRSGKVTTEYSGRLWMPGSTATTTFQNYVVDSVKVEGTHKISNTGSATQRQFTIDVTGARLTKPSGNYTAWNSRRVLTQTEGFATAELAADDAFTITGESNGEVKKRNFITNWEATIKEPLLKRFACRWISKGVVTLSRQRLATGAKWNATLNYGNGDCDRKAFLIINEKVREITLH